MRKRIVSAFTLSVILPLVAFTIIAMKLTGAYRWYLAGAFYFGGWLCLVLAVRKHRRSLVFFKRGQATLTEMLRDNSKFIAASLLVPLLIYLGWLFFPMERIDFIKADPVQLEKQIDSDLAALSVCVRGIENAVSAIEKDSDLLLGDVARLTHANRTRLLELWSRFLAYSIELEKLKHIHKHFYQINYKRMPELKLRSFLTAYTAFIANYLNTLRLTAIVGIDDNIKTFLNEQRVQLEIPGNAYFALTQVLVNPDSMLRLNAGQAHLQFLKATGKLTSDNEQSLIRYSETGFRQILRMLGKQPERFVEPSKDVFERMTFVAWFPFQKRIAESMSLLRTTHRENFITLNDIRLIEKELEPGDILLERRNWYLTNVGIPGFWPHTALYTGSLKKMDEYFKDVPAPGNLSVSGYLKKNQPELFKKLSIPTPEGYSLSVLEALRPGVIPTPLEVSARADYLAALRPRLPKQDRLLAILKAFTFYNRPYDYNFDFVTDNELVCSEVIFKAYQPGRKRNGLNLQLRETAGRLLLPPNDIAKKFDAECHSPDAELRFILFLDGSETEKKATRKNVDEFRKSYRRPRWDVIQK